MADSKVSALTAATAVTGADEVPIVQSASSKRSTLTIIREWLFPLLGALSKFVPLGVNTDGAGANDGILRDRSGVAIDSIKANVVHRYGALSTLTPLTAPNGEIAVANDRNALVFIRNGAAKTIHQDGPASLPLADITTGRVGWFGPTIVSYTMNLATYPTFQDLIDYLEACSIDRNATLSINLPALSGSAVDVSKNLSNVLFTGQREFGITIACTGTTATTATFSCTAGTQPLVGEVVAFEDAQAVGQTDGNLAKYTGAFRVSSSSAGSFTLEMASAAKPTVQAEIVNFYRYQTVALGLGVTGHLNISYVAVDGTLTCTDALLSGTVAVAGTFSVIGGSASASVFCGRSITLTNDAEFVGIATSADSAGDGYSLYASGSRFQGTLITANSAALADQGGVIRGRLECHNSTFGVQVGAGGEFVGPLAAPSGTVTTLRATDAGTPLAANTFAADGSIIRG